MIMNAPQRSEWRRFPAQRIDAELLIVYHAPRRILLGCEVAAILRHARRLLRTADPVSQIKSTGGESYHAVVNL